MTVEAQIADPVSGLTTDASAFKKRPRSDPTPHRTLDQLHPPMASTSGRPPVLSLLHHHNAEIDALLRFQMGKLRSGLEEARKRQCRAIIGVMEQHMNRKMEEKMSELEALKRRNAELEEKARQLAAEGQIWFQVARNSEAVVMGLRSSLEQALLTGSAGYAGKEGYGETGDDAESCCYDDESRPEAPVAAAGRACRVCGEVEACVLVLPCRHVCLCDSCEPGLDTCPVCRFPKNRSLRIFLQ